MMVSILARSEIRLPPKIKQSHAERSRVTKNRLLEATVSELVDKGYAGLSTSSVVQRAGLSRGAQVHHYPRKADLIQAASHHLALRARDELSLGFQRLKPGVNRGETTLQLLWRGYDSEFMVACFELILAGRLDPELQIAVEQLQKDINGTIAGFIQQIYGDISARNLKLKVLVDASLLFMTGLAFNRLQQDQAWVNKQFKSWRQLMLPLFAELEAL